MANTISFQVNEKNYSVRLPNSREREEGERIYNRVFAYTLKMGGLLDGQVMSIAREHGLWTDEKDQEVSALKKELGDYEQVLEQGGIELDEAKEIALKMKEARTKLFLYNLMLEEIRGESVSRKATLAQIEFFVSRCTLDENNKLVYKDLDDFYTRQNDQVAQDAIANFNKLWYNYNDDMFSFPEDKFMQEYFKEELVTEPKKEKKPFLKNGKPVNAN